MEHDNEGMAMKRLILFIWIVLLGYRSLAFVPDATGVTNIVNSNTAALANGLASFTGSLVTTNYPIYTTLTTNFSVIVLNGGGNFNMMGKYPYASNIANVAVYTNVANNGFVILTNTAASPKIIVSNTIDGGLYGSKTSFPGVSVGQIGAGTSSNFLYPPPIAWFQITNSGQSGTATAIVPTVPSMFIGNSNVFVVCQNGNDAVGSGGGLAYKTMDAAFYQAALTPGRNVVFLSPGFYQAATNRVPTWTTLVGAPGFSSVITNGNILIASCGVGLQDLMTTNIGNVPTTANVDNCAVLDVSGTSYPFVASITGSAQVQSLNPPTIIKHCSINGNCDGYYIEFTPTITIDDCISGSTWDSGFFGVINNMNVYARNSIFYSVFDFNTVSNFSNGTEGNWSGTGIQLASLNGLNEFDNCKIISSNQPTVVGQLGVSIGSYGFKLWGNTNTLFLNGCTLYVGNTNSGGKYGTIQVPPTSSGQGFSNVVYGYWNTASNWYSTLIQSNNISSVGTNWP